MTIDGKEIGITKQPFSILKKNVCDDSKDLEDMIKRVKEYQHQLDEKMLTIEKTEQQEITQNREKIEVRTNPSIPLFAKETVERIEKINSLKDEYEREA